MVIISKDRLLVIKTESHLVFRSSFDCHTNLYYIGVDYVEDGVKLSYVVAEYANENECRDAMENVIKLQLEHGTIINPIDCIDFSKL